MTHNHHIGQSLDPSFDKVLEQIHHYLHEGQPLKAKPLCDTLLDQQPDNPEIHYLLGLINIQIGQVGQGLVNFEAAIEKRPEHAPYWLAYIDALDQDGQSDIARQMLEMARQAGLSGEEADILATRLNADTVPSHSQDSESITARSENDNIDKLLSLYQQGLNSDCENLARNLLQIFPENSTIWKVFGAVLYQQQRFQEAILAMRQAATLSPNDHDALNNLGLTLKLTENLHESEIFLRKALLVKKDFAEAHNNLGVTLLAQGRFDEANSCFLQAHSLRPDYAEAQNNLGICLKNQNRYDEAEHTVRRLLQANPDYYEAWNNLGNILKEKNRLTEAKSCFHKALDLQPTFAVAWKNLGDVFQGQGEIFEAEECYNKALRLKPHYADAFDGLLFTANYHPDRRSEDLFQLYQQYNVEFGLPQTKFQQPHENSRNLNRRLKIGYVSPAFYQHPVLHFLLPLLAHHDKDHFEVYAYSETLREDQATILYRTYCDHWIVTIGLSDEELTARIREDRIDILIDLASHTGRNRLNVFARKPAPVSLHWLDFGYTTGLTAIDYYLTDLNTAPLGSEHLFSEKLWRLPGSPFAYRPEHGMGIVSTLPAERNGFVTFGTLSRAIRINYCTIRVWAEILKQTNNSQLIIDSVNFKDRLTQDALRQKFIEQGITGARLIIGYHSPPWDILREIDISLDCFPHNSGTTLFESLFMGVPFITLADKPGIGRLGCSILENGGHPEWIAKSEEEYIEKAVTLAKNHTALAHLRSKLREDLKNSPLMDEQKFTKGVEDAYHQMFQQWCSQNRQAGDDADTLLTNGNNLAMDFYNRAVDNQVNGNIIEAKKQYVQAINLYNTFSPACNNLGVIFQQEGNYEDAATCFLHALALKPNYTDAHFNLGNTRKFQHRLLDAERAYRNTLNLKPNHVEALHNLGNNLQEQGRHEEAEQYLRQALALDPTNKNIFSTLLFTLNYSPEKKPEEIFQAYEECNRLLFLPYTAQWHPHTNKKPTNRRLRIGYVAADYRKHPSRHFLLPLLSHHNRRLVDIFAYVEVSPQEMSGDLFAGYVEHWRATRGLTDEQFCEQIRHDAIDILVDLAGHTAHNRLGVFSRKPAPVSLHWLDFGYTTGLTAIDYYLTDEITVPPGSEHLFSETPWRLTTPAIAYRPPEDAGPVNILPAKNNGYTSFGCLSRATRINQRTINIWAEILKKCPGSKLIINSGSYREQGMRDILADRFQVQGIEKERLEIGCNSPPWDVFRKIDIGFDCFPHNSGTTLVESLYMGVPYITLADRPSVGRLGGSILHGVGHPEWIANTEEEYIIKALDLAADYGRLSAIRSGLRATMISSPLMDECGFTARLETVYQEMFALWYSSQPAKGVRTLSNSQQQSTKINSKNPKRIKNKTQQKTSPPDVEIDQLTKLFNAGNIVEATRLAKSLTNRFPHHGFGWKVLGPLLHKQGFSDDAIKAMQQAVSCLPADPDTYCNLGIALQQAGLLLEAAKNYEKTLHISNGHLQAKFNLANIYKETCQLEEAEKLYREVLKQKPDFFEAYCNLGNTLRACGKHEDSVNCFRSALRIRPDSAEALCNLGLTLRTQGKFSEAENSLRQALQQKPNLTEAHNNLGLVYQDQGRLSEAQLCYEQGLAIDPQYAVTYHNLGNTFLKQGRISEAEISLRQAIALQPGSPATHSDLLFLLNNHPDKNSEEIFEEYKQFNSKFAIPLQVEWKPFSVSNDTNRRLKVGYVSSNFYKHSIRHFLEPLLAHHDKSAFELYAYTDQSHEDEVTLRYQSYIDHWQQHPGISDSALTELIRHDRIDILVDLAGHTGGNRLGVFARKPAPVSVHWLDFGYTTGLTAIDYYLTDNTTVPHESNHLFGETPWRIKTPCLVYRPAEDMGTVSTLPALTRGYVSFGTLTRALRINHRTIRVWSKILHQVEGSHLVIDSSNYKDESVKSALENAFIAQGVLPDRLEIGYHSPPWDLLRRIDIGFDCFPHNSGTTLFENLFLGIPFITLADRPCIGLLGSAILEGLGHPEWIAKSEDEYIDKAVALATDLTKLNTLRTGLREEMENSPLMDEPGFAFKIETAFKEMFQKWSISNNRNSLPKQRDDQPLNVMQKTGSTPTIPPPQNHSSSYKHAKPKTKDTAKAVALFHKGDFNGAATLTRRLIQQFPEDGFSWKILGTALLQQGQLDEALTVMRQAAPFLQTDAEFHNNYAIVLFKKGFHVEAETEINRALTLNPKFAEAYSNMGDILQQRGQYAEAERNYIKYLSFKKESHEVYCNLSKSLINQGRPMEAADYCQKALRLQPTYAEAYNCLGIALANMNRHQEAVTNYKKAIDFRPDYAEVYNNLANSLVKQGFYTEAKAFFKRALQLKPDYADGYNNLGNLFKELGLLSEAELNYRKALELNPNSAPIYGNMLFLLNNHPDKTAEEIFKEYQNFNKQFAVPFEKEWQPFANYKKRNRRIKVGYVSSKFCKHSTRHFLEPLLSSHDKNQVEIYIYADQSTKDAVTDRYKSYCDHWVQCAGFDDGELSARIRTDLIDILVDLSGHTDGNRLGVFARKPAPISLHWLDFGYTTGLTAINYYLTDSVNVPKGSESLFAETPWRVQTPCLVYRPAKGMGECGPLPALRKKHITFCTLTRALRINHRTLRAWAEILRRVKGAHLVIDSSNYHENASQLAIRNKFIAMGINPEQLEIGFTSPPWNLLRNIDIGLDCFPHNSGTTLIETLYMGAPFITLADRPSVGLLGSSILEAIGHPEWIAQTEEDYITKAVALADNLPELATLRAGLRQEMQLSPLMDEHGFARKVESAYREMFIKWCEEQS